ncbi:hypothetical protein B0O99DRAFT_679827 [Bisporella sp. PMI_857]|nr:hypothetical protein B0O99DRAFT_679827 [Bisporella sp. PMI_857]
MFFQSLVSLWVIFLLGVEANPQLPPPTGHQKIGVLHLEVVDHTRKDLFSPLDNRKLMISIYYPTKEKTVDAQPYITPVVASLFEVQHSLPNGSLSTVIDNSKIAARPLPIHNTRRLLFSHGGGQSRLIHTALLEDLASHGYVAVSIDHPYDAAAVEFPDGSVIYRDSSPFTTILLDNWYRQRIDDIYFIDNITSDLSILYGHPRNTHPAAVAGHSFGGAAAAGAMIESHRFVGGFNFDGAFWNNSISGDAQRPFFIMGGPIRIPAGDTSWDSFRAAQTGWEREAIVNGTQHFAFTDFVALVDLLGLPRTPEIEAFVGTIGTSRAIEIQRVYLRSFVDWVFGRGNGGLIDGPSSEFPEIEFMPPENELNGASG